jgi:hypothetical protein
LAISSRVDDDDACFLGVIVDVVFVWGILATVGLRVFTGVLVVVLTSVGTAAAVVGEARSDNSSEDGVVVDGVGGGGGERVASG